jgi:hypothetical protein
MRDVFALAESAAVKAFGFYTLLPQCLSVIGRCSSSGQVLLAVSGKAQLGGLTVILADGF